MFQDQAKKKINDKTKKLNTTHDVTSTKHVFQVFHDQRINDLTDDLPTHFYRER